MLDINAADAQGVPQFVLDDYLEQFLPHASSGFLFLPSANSTPRLEAPDRHVMQLASTKLRDLASLKSENGALWQRLVRRINMTGPLYSTIGSLTQLQNNFLFSGFRFVRMTHHVDDPQDTYLLEVGVGGPINRGVYAVDEMQGVPIQASQYWRKSYPNHQASPLQVGFEIRHPLQTGLGVLFETSDDPGEIFNHLATILDIPMQRRNASRRIGDYSSGDRSTTLAISPDIEGDVPHIRIKLEAPAFTALPEALHALWNSAVTLAAVHHDAHVAGILKVMDQQLLAADDVLKLDLSAVPKDLQELVQRKKKLASKRREANLAYRRSLQSSAMRLAAYRTIAKVA